jgi:hypothetical protein
MIPKHEKSITEKEKPDTYKSEAQKNKAASTLILPTDTEITKPIKPSYQTIET